MAYDPPPKKRVPKPNGKVNPLTANMTAEERSELGRRLAAVRKKPARREGTPVTWNYKDYAVEQEAAKREAQRIYKIMEQNGQVPDDPMAQEAMLAALQLMREPGNKDFKLKAIRTVLEWTKAKPTSKQDITVRSAEDFLDELAAKEGDD